METKEENIGKLETQLQQWGATLDDLIAKADQKSGEAKLEYHKSIDDLKAKRRLAQAKLDEIRAASVEQWETLKASLEKAWNEFEVAFKEVTSSKDEKNQN